MVVTLAPLVRCLDLMTRFVHFRQILLCALIKVLGVSVLTMVLDRIVSFFSVSAYRGM